MEFQRRSVSSAVNNKHGAQLYMDISCIQIELKYTIDKQ